MLYVGVSDITYSKRKEEGSFVYGILYFVCWPPTKRWLLMPFM